MDGSGDTRYVIDLLFEARLRPFRGQLRPTSPDTGPRNQDFQEIVTIIASSDHKAY